MKKIVLILKNKYFITLISLSVWIVFFYKNDLQIFIKKADKKDISEYENEFKKDNLGIIIGKVKSVVEKNIILPNGYLFEDLKSIDIVFLFLEIVKLTKNKSINIF